jgi:RNA ligase
VLNYTEKAAYEGAWNAVTLACRGLIYHRDTLEIIARPFAKFFNHGQAGCAHIPLNAPVQVTDKADGSLAVIFRLPSTGELAVATRGSFTSEQAIHATALLRTDRYADLNLDPGFTFLAEIIYPGNRIVVDYQDLDDLVLLGCVNIDSGKTWGPDAYPTWPGPAAKVFGYQTLGEALAAPARDNAEGFVVRDLATDARLKIKYETYVHLHRIITGLNARVVWEHLVAGKPLNDLIEPLPDEFRSWVEEVAATITTQVDEQLAAAQKAYGEILAQLPEGFSRGDFARLAKQTEHAASLFFLLDGRDPRPKLLIHAKPEPFWNPAGRTFTEDNA